MSSSRIVARFPSIMWWILGFWLFARRVCLCEAHIDTSQLRYDGDLGPRFQHSNNSSSNQLLGAANSLLETRGGALSALSWLQGAQDIIASPAGHVMVQMAKELLNRSTGNSQVTCSVFIPYRTKSLNSIHIMSRCSASTLPIWWLSYS